MEAKTNKVWFLKHAGSFKVNLGNLFRGLGNRFSHFT